MKKLLLIAGILIIAGVSVLFFLGGEETPTVETPAGGSPFGSGEGVNIPVQETSTVGEVTPFDEKISSEDKLFRISNTPTAGFVVFNRGGNTIVRYAERATGHIFDALLTKEGSAGGLEKVRVTNNTLPKVYEAYFRADGLAVLFRSLENNSDSVSNLTLSLTPPRTSPTSTSSPQTTDALHSVTATNLRGDIDSIAVGSGNTLFYALRSSSAIVSSSFTGDNSKTLFASQFKNWRIGRLGNNLLIYPKASALAQGYLYSLNSSGGSPAKLLGPLFGLTATANPAGNRVLYSYIENGQTKLFVKNLQSGALSEILPATLTEKCVWSAKDTAVLFCGVPITTISGNEPDGWYAGKTHFTDYLWKFDNTSEAAELISQPKTDFELDLDVSELRLSSDEDHLIFINKRDQTLWAVRL